MNIAQAIVVLANITSSGITLLQQAQAVSQMIARANSEGRSEFTPEEWSLITGADDAARKALVEAIAGA